jgi:hypothetical protein
MKKNRFTQFTMPIAMASGLVVLFAGCQVAPPAANAPVQEGTVGGNKAAKPVTPGTANNNPTAPVMDPNAANNTPTNADPGNPANPAEATVVAGKPTMKPDAKITGVVKDINGNPIAGVQVNAYNGFQATTDANGNYTIDVVAQDNLRLDFSKPGVLMRQEHVSVVPGQTGLIDTKLKMLDPAVSHVSAKEGGTVTSSDGSSQLIIPPGALTQDGDVRLTWMDPVPSDNFPMAYGQLPGPLVTRTMPSGATAAEEYNIPPIAFTNVEMTAAKLAPGAQATLRMRVNPEALTALGDSIDFNNPATLQQPCYDYDRGRGLWVNPATSKVEKDENGVAWFVYTLKGVDAPKNFFGLLQTITTGNYVTGQQTIYWTEQVLVPVTVSNPGGGSSTVWVWQTVTRSASKTSTASSSRETSPRSRRTRPSTASRSPARPSVTSRTSSAAPPRPRTPPVSSPSRCGTTPAA